MDTLAFDHDGDHPCRAARRVPFPLLPKGSLPGVDRHLLRCFAAHPALPLHQQEQLGRDRRVVADHSAGTDMHAAHLRFRAEPGDAGQD
jgi:hypothetical protein